MHPRSSVPIALLLIDVVAEGAVGIRTLFDDDVLATTTAQNEVFVFERFSESFD